MWPCELMKTRAEEDLSFLLCVLQHPFFLKTKWWFKGLEGWHEQRCTSLGGLHIQAADGIKARIGVMEISRGCESFLDLILGHLMLEKQMTLDKRVVGLEAGW